MSSEPYLTPATIHGLDQFLAFALEVHLQLLAHKKALLQEGWSEPEAWALCMRMEERILGPLMDEWEEEGP